MQLREQRIEMRRDGMTYPAIAEASGVDASTALRQTAQIANANSEILTKRVSYLY